MKRVFFIVCVLALAGCSNTAWQVSGGHANVTSNVQVYGSGGFAAALGLGLIAAGAWQASRSEAVFAASDSPPAMAPGRRVSEQDCTQPLDTTLGNIRCK